MYSIKESNDFFDRELKGSSVQDCIDKVFQLHFLDTSFRVQTVDDFNQLIAKSEEADVRAQLIQPQFS